MSNTTRVDRRMRALALARDCVGLGARILTIHHITGISKRELQRLLCVDGVSLPRGRTPDTREWYHNANLLSRTEASVVVVTFRRLCESGFSPGEALVSAYRYYLSVFRPPHRISFDRAFDLASHADGIWLAKSPSFALLSCPACRSLFLDAPGGPAAAHRSCLFCRLVKRHPCDPRVQASFHDAPTVPRATARLLIQQLITPAAAHPDGETPPHST